MIDLSTLPVFLVATIVLLVIPGPAVLYIIARSLDQGQTAGIVSVLGVTCGSAIHVVFAALGISAILVRSVTAFNVIKYAGAAYLIVLGVRKLRERTTPTSVQTPPPAPLLTIFRQGVVVNVLNPKTALFFFAFLPQFVRPESGTPGLQILVLGLIFLTIALVSDGTYALLAARAGRLLRGNLRFAHFQKWFAGLVYIGLGVLTALTASRTSQS